MWHMDMADSEYIFLERMNKNRGDNSPAHLTGSALVLLIVPQ